MKYFLYPLFLIISILFSQLSVGQGRQSREAPSINGIVLDPDGELVPFANVALYQSQDSTLISGEATDIEGKFSIKTKPGKYYLVVSFLSLKPKTIGNIDLGRETKTLGKIQLEENSQLLDEVEITAERSQMELKLDKRVFNIEKDLSNAGANAAEILNNLPSVEVDVEGNVSLRGSQNVRVLIDGKPSTITAGSVGEALRQFQGNMIESVEIITNPSSRYDAEGEVGIINIKLKKEKQKGLNGSVEAVAGYPDNYRASFNLNYRTKNFNLFTSMGGAYRNSPGGGFTNQTFNSPDTSYIYKSTNDRTRGGFSNNFRLGSDIFLNDKNTITVAGFYRFSDEENIAEIAYEDFFANGELYRRVDREDVESEDGENLESSINYTKTFEKEDQKFTIDLQWSERDDLEESDITEIDNLTGDLLLQESSNLEFNRTYLMQSDYIHPIGKDGLFETGFRSTLRTVENDFQVKESTNGSAFSILEDFNNNFIYNENIYAGYLMYGNKKGAFSYQLGVRAEYSDISTELKKTNESNNWQYLNLFPSAHLTYKLKNKDDFQLSYSRRINRPGFRELLPFSNFTDARNFWAGNPELQPEYTNSYEIGYLKYFKKGSLFSSVYYRHRTGVIDRIITTDAAGITYRIPVNLATEHNVGFELNSSYDLNKKNKVSANFNFFHSERSGSYEGQVLENSTFAWNSRIVYRSEILPKIDAQASLNYRAPINTTQGKMKSVSSIDLSLSKDVLKGKGTLVASVRDLLNTRKRRSITDTEYLYTESEFQWRARQFLLSFTYRINKKKSRGPSRQGGDSNDSDDF